MYIVNVALTFFVSQAEEEEEEEAVDDDGRDGGENIDEPGV